MGNFLAIDTSSRYLNVIAQKGKNIAQRFLADCSMQHSVVLMGEIQSALDEVCLTSSECDFFAAVTGPGSFTGIRIGIATAKGFAVGADKPLLGVTSFDMLAYNVNSEKFFIAIDAAHSHYYVCGYCGGKIFSEPRYSDKDTLLSYGLPVFGFEDLPLENYTKLDVKNCLHPAICLSEGNLSHEISALYVRKSQAEEERIKREVGKK